jgi:A/G-specific adenine glycosylase
MLQQTQVATVIPYFKRFLDAFPTLAALAAADEQDVLRLWEGLGYYRRARDLHRAARLVVTEFGDRVPTDAESWQRLPGIGRYTLGAILSQAFDQRLPIVEANSQRVLCRLFGQREHPQHGDVRRWLWRVAAALLPRRTVGDFNQALMELGALVCTPAAPRCGACPLARLCTARRLGLQPVIPPPAEQPRPVLVQEAAVLVRRGGQVLLARRPDRGRWAGLWEFPRAALEKGETHSEAAGRLLPQLTGIHALLGLEFMTVRHTVTRHHITLVCFEANYRKGRFRSDFYQNGVWVKPADLREYPFSVPQRRLSEALLRPARQKRLF